MKQDGQTTNHDELMRRDTWETNYPPWVVVASGRPSIPACR